MPKSLPVTERENAIADSSENTDLTVLLRRASDAQLALLEHTLLDEYHTLADLELQNMLTPTQRERFQTVNWLLDNLDTQSQGAVVMERRIRETQDQLDAILNTVEQFPNRVAK